MSEVLTNPKKVALDGKFQKKVENLTKKLSEAEKTQTCQYFDFLFIPLDVHGFFFKTVGYPNILGHFGPSKEETWF